ncbi:endonuclease/exonuclease/phosphatase family protein [Dysgonomonas sp. 25]|uniref:endonuclease/exonuclease/phosphatase family protein n=1 Tax=Dysgonomonas sp. 25 TaxID=2302933 RepID=UPI002105C734|nr:endonuclease/exonuclease/phosphatase family protein [Dysgonomonas sp. 25]
MNRILLLSLLFIITLSSYAQGDFRIMFYNVENLFDTKDNPNTNDDAFLPEGTQRWSNYRYWEKLKAVSNVIDSVGNGYPPALVGMCEVENDSVLFDLCKRSPLRKHKYEYLISQSKDNRGINVALLYQRDEMKVLSTKEYTPVFDDSTKHTRNILHVTGLIVNRDTLDVFVCHFPSRNEGIKRTQPYRIIAAKLLRKQVDKVLAKRRNPNVIIMGDFNDYPDDVSMQHILEAQSLHKKKETNNLYNLFLHRIDDKNQGSYRYRGKWQYVDQFVVSGNLLKGRSKTQVKDFSAHIYKADFLLEEDVKYGGAKPFRTYSGYKYLGGTSDHLPIYMDLIIKE